MSIPEGFMPGATLMESLQACVGMPVTVFVTGVHGALDMGPGPHPGPHPGPGPCPPGWGPGVGPGRGMPGTWPGVPYADAPEAKRGLRPPCPEPMPPCPPMPPCDGMETTVVQGILVFAGADYLSVQVGYGGTPNHYKEVVIPYNAIGMVICGQLYM